MASKTACVVGCSGFVGSNVTSDLLSKGYTVRGTISGKGDDSKYAWLHDLSAANGGRLSLFSYDLTAEDSNLGSPLEGCTSVFLCAGHEKKDPDTIPFMVNYVLRVLQTAVQKGVEVAVITSSTGSCNPPGDEPELKNELFHFSDPELQKSLGKWSPAAKTLMEQAATKFSQENPIRVCIMNPSLIIGPMLQPTPYGSSIWLAKIVRGEAMAKVPNDSMSIIDVRDLAALHVAAAELESASGRYFGVRESWHWIDILQCLHTLRPSYAVPPTFEGEPIRPTMFDLTRQASLGVKVRDIPDALKGTLEYLTRVGELSS